MRRTHLRTALLPRALYCALYCSCLSGCTYSFWNSSANESTTVDPLLIGSGQQVISSPTDGTPWQGDRVDKGFGF
jgi:hypothetical protein